MTHRLLADALHTAALVLGLIGMIRDVGGLNADLPLQVAVLAVDQAREAIELAGGCDRRAQLVTSPLRRIALPNGRSSPVRTIRKARSASA